MTNKLVKKIGFLIPVHNESAVLIKNIKELLRFCENNDILPEIIICENGSTDSTSEILKQIDSEFITKLYMKERGLGAAYRKCIMSSSSEILYFTGIDFPFGFENILDCLVEISNFDFVFASKAHPKSITRPSIIRRITSTIYRKLLSLLLEVKIRDTQGCVMFKKSAAIKIIKYCDSDGIFFQTQIPIHARRMGMKITEIPVKYLSPRKNSKIHITSDGFLALSNIMKERKKIKAIK